ncbi:SH3 domain-containing protein [Cypionkella sinensis]|uniref:SH3 domain-containing protein n=1 Tax=Cypionkella sinensis TaxID=1756043 RepID=A0ABV7IX11_9RHOB
MRYIALPIGLALLLVAGCAEMSSSHAVVKGAGPDELLKLRAGPGLGYKIIVGLPDGTRLTRHTCVTEEGQLWCEVTVNASPYLKGYVSADYLSAK